MAYGSALVDTIQSSTAGTAPQFKDGNGTQVGTLCRAWVNFNGTGTVAIRASFNVSSITDNGTGDYSINFTNALPDANYTVCGIGPTVNGTNGATIQLTNAVSPPQYTTYVRIGTQVNNTLTDQAYMQIAVFR